MLNKLLPRWPRATPRLAVAVLTGLLLPALASSPAAGPEEAPRTAAVVTPKTTWGLQAWHERHQHLAAMGVVRWQAAGYRGRGVKVAILDTGFRGYRAHLGAALPAHVTVHSFRDDGDLEGKDSQHGILCAEVIHAIAPEAELLLANWDWGCPEQFLAAVRWARSQGARVISCSCIMPSWSDGEGGGAAHRELAALLGPGGSPADALCFASAGNTAERHWGGPFRDGGDGFHQWQPGCKDNALRPWSEEPVVVDLYARPGTDYALYVYDSDTGKEVAHVRTTSRPGDRAGAAVRFPPVPEHMYRLRVRRLSGPPGVFHVTTTFGSLKHVVAHGNVCFPADGAEAIAMGAVDWQGRRQPYSACGPNSPLPKPDFVAVVPFPSLWRPRPMGGTSAAAPQGAALAALLWSRQPDWNADRVRAALRASCRDLGPVGHDWETGYGLLRLP
jgi:subtilisin family serine protease